MAITIKDAFGNNSTPSVTGTPGLYIYGPPAFTQGDSEGEYLIYSGAQGTNGTYAWVRDCPRTAGSGARSTYVARGF